MNHQETGRYFEVASVLFPEFEEPECRIPFIGSGNIWIERHYDRYERDLARFIIQRAVMNTAEGELSIVGYDPILSGIFAPFSALCSGETKIIDFIDNEEDFSNMLKTLKHEIRQVQNVIQGTSPSLRDFRLKAKRPVEKYKLVVLCMAVKTLDSKTKYELSNILGSGPEVGITFLIISGSKNNQVDLAMLDPEMTMLEPTSATSFCINNQINVNYTPDDAEALVACSETLHRKLSNIEPPSISFSSLFPNDEDNFEKNWSRAEDPGIPLKENPANSASGLTFPIGKYGLRNAQITLGDEINQRHNMVITGAVGQGKSNLISVIVNSMCIRYSPKELNLYLLDFKEGVTFKSFSNLPHVRAIGLESDSNFGQAMLCSLFDVYKRRMNLFKRYNVKNMFEYKKTYRKAMPRIVVIIDEFQMMFGDDQETADVIAGDLEKSLRLFRAAGINFILASQTLAGSAALNGRKENIFSQMPIRIAHKNSLSESFEILGIGNSAATGLRRGEAIVNVDYGHISQNQKVQIAFVDENSGGQEMSRLRDRMGDVAARLYHSTKEMMMPYLFRGEVPVLADVAAHECPGTEPNARVALLGRQIAVGNSPMQVPVYEEKGRNIAVFGSNYDARNNALGIIEGAAVSLARQSREGDRFVFCDFSIEGGSFREINGQFLALLEKTCKGSVEVKKPSEFEELLDELDSCSFSGARTYVFALSLDRFERRNAATDDFGIPVAPLKKLVENGPAQGVHFIGWWYKESSFIRQTVGESGSASDAFNTRIFLRLPSDSVLNLTEPGVRWNPADNRAMIYDGVAFGKEQVFIPYSPMKQQKGG